MLAASPEQYLHSVESTSRIAGAWLLASALIPPATLAQRGDSVRRAIALTVDGTLAAPHGWVQVGEDTTPGTRLDFRRDLHVRTSGAASLALTLHPDRRTRGQLVVEMHFLDGSALLPGDVSFNGTTLAGGTRLATRTNGTAFLRVTLLARRRLAGWRDGARVDALAGLTYVSLNYEMHGTLAASSAKRETSEDFDTQELPVPMLGLSTERPLGRASLRASLAGGWLPWTYSLRNEGGHVNLTQRHVDADLGLALAIGRSSTLDMGLRARHFAQHERSAEDDNAIQLDELGVRLGITARY